MKNINITVLENEEDLREALSNSTEEYKEFIFDHYSGKHIVNLRKYYSEVTQVELYCILYDCKVFKGRTVDSAIKKLKSNDYE